MSGRALPALVAASLLVLAGPAAAAPRLEELPPVPTADAGLQDIVQGPDGNMWFTERNVNKIGRISPASPATATEFAIATNGSGPDIIVVGPDGNLWYTELNSKSVGRMPPANPAGVQRFAALGLVSPRGIAAGPDGNLWVADADPAAPKVVIVSPAGAAVGLPIALPAGFNPRGIALGPDGNMWVANFSTPGSVARVRPGPAPAVAAFPVPAGSPIDLIGGADGNVWYAGQGTAVGRVAPDGTATAFTSKGVDPFGVALGPDGAVWYAEFQANAVGRVDRSGATSHVTGMTGAAGPRYVASGPQNTIWFTEETGNRVGRITGIELPDGPGVGPAPALTRLRLSARRFRIGFKRATASAVRTGTTIRYRLSEPATVRLSFERALPGRRVRGRCAKPRRANRLRKRCTRYVAVRPALRFGDQAAGQRRIRFQGRLSPRRTLKPGRYRLSLRARDAAGNASKPLRARIVVLPRKRR